MDRLIRPGDYNDRQGTRREGASGRMPIRIVRRARRLRSATSGNVGRSLVRTAVYSSVMRGLTACRCTDSQVIDVDTNIYRGRTASGLRPGNNNELTKELTLIKKNHQPNYTCLPFSPFDKRCKAYHIFELPLFCHYISMTYC